LIGTVFPAFSVIQEAGISKAIEEVSWIGWVSVSRITTLTLTVHPGVMFKNLTVTVLLSAESLGSLRSRFCGSIVNDNDLEMISGAPGVMLTL
jgi:hypothetical protein